MEGRSTLPARKELHPRLVSITPSESPPVSRLFQTPTSNRLNKAPVSKRPRLSSTPSSLFSTASSSTIVHTEEIDEGLRASSMRLLSVWDQLAERYNRPLDEDDIVDLRDNSLFKDRGVVRQSRRTYEIGCFGDDNSRSDANDASSEGGDVPYDDDVDELDAFAPEADISGKLELEKGKLNVPPMREMDPDDAQDLKEFMEAEARRKELYGDEEAVEDVTDVRLAYGDETDFEDNLDTKDDYADFDFSKAGDEAILVPDGDSEDEFATWDFDASSAKPVTCHSDPAPRLKL
ncbi:hypothetical protein A0H81_11359 [Grifola frondosa]|uniref:Uncharacterized protein n=1 Tax=Grifola frondosa TaxID=5627 RepID=A0A1C7LY08_GRIFR|nr:hypothetical protein A0H81_11359 [Grifola frondosa]